MFSEPNRDRLIIQLLGFLIKETGNDIHKSINFNNIYHKACIEGSFIAAYFDSADTEMKDKVRREAIDKRYIQNDPDNSDNIMITDNGIKEFHRSTGIGWDKTFGVLYNNSNCYILFISQASLLYRN